MSFRDHYPDRFTPRAACVLIPCDGGLFYAIDSVKHPGKLIIPGGKIEPGETAEQAAVRECIEEINVDPFELRHLFDAPAGAFMCAAFVAMRETVASSETQCTYPEGPVSLYTAGQILQRAVYPYLYARMLAVYHEQPIVNGWTRAASECVCDLCGLEYWKHQEEPSDPWLTRLCNGMLVKL